MRVFKTWNSEEIPTFINFLVNKYENKPYIHVYNKKIAGAF